MSKLFLALAAPELVLAAVGAEMFRRRPVRRRQRNLLVRRHRRAAPFQRHLQLRRRHRLLPARIVKNATCYGTAIATGKPCGSDGPTARRESVISWCAAARSPTAILAARTATAAAASATSLSQHTHVRRATRWQRLHARPGVRLGRVRRRQMRRARNEPNLLSRQGLSIGRLRWRERRWPERRLRPGLTCRETVAAAPATRTAHSASARAESAVNRRVVPAAPTMTVSPCPSPATRAPASRLSPTARRARPVHSARARSASTQNVAWPPTAPPAPAMATVSRASVPTEKICGAQGNGARLRPRRRLHPRRGATAPPAARASSTERIAAPTTTASPRCASTACARKFVANGGACSSSLECFSGYLHRQRLQLRRAGRPSPPAKTRAARGRAANTTTATDPERPVPVRR